MSVVYSFRDSLTIDETILDQWSAQNPNLMPSAYGGHARARRSALSAGEPVLRLRLRDHGRLTHDRTDDPDVACYWPVGGSLRPGHHHPRAP